MINTSRSPGNTTRSTRQIGAVVAVLALLGAACGSDDAATASSDEGVAVTDETTGVATAPDDSAGDSSATQDSGAASGKTIRLGFVNMDAGPFAFPEFRIGGEVAADQINATGGINGATIELVSCSTDLTPESSIDCANQLVEADVAVAFTAIDLASDAALPVYQEAGIPYVTTNSWGSVQSNAEGSHILHLPGQGYAVGAGALAQQLGLTKIAQPYEVSPSAEDLALVQVPPIADQMGVEIQPIAVDGAAPDWTAAVATAQSSGAEMIWAQLSEPGCTAMVAAARAADLEGPVVAGECSAFIAELGDDAVGTYTLQNTLQPTTRASAPAEIAERLDEYAQLMDAAGQSKYTEGYATWPYGGLMEFRSILESIDGEVNAASVEAALDRDTEVPGWFGESINCGAPPWPESSANCSAAVSVYQVAEAEDGSLVRNQVIDFFDTYDRAQQ